MKLWVDACLLSIATLMPMNSFAQGVDAGLTGVGLVSFQLPARTYVGSTYLSRDVGLLGVGLGVGVSVITPSKFVAVGEFSSAWFSATQSGRSAGPVRTFTWQDPL